MSDEAEQEGDGLTLTIERIPANASPPPPVSSSAPTVNVDHRSMSILDGYTPTLDRDTKEVYKRINEVFRAVYLFFCFVI